MVRVAPRTIVVGPYLRDRVEVPATIGEDELQSLVLAREKVVAATPDGVRTVIVRAPKLVNVVPV